MQQHVVCGYLVEHLLCHGDGGGFVLYYHLWLCVQVVEHAVATKPFSADGQFHLICQHRRRIAEVFGQIVHEMLADPFLGGQRHVFASQTVENHWLAVARYDFCGERWQIESIHFITFATAKIIKCSEDKAKSSAFFADDVFMMHHHVPAGRPLSITNRDAMAIKQTFDTIMRDLKARKFYPIYILMGEESYYIDQLSDYIENNVLQPEERDFNQTVVYGVDVNAVQVADLAKRFPMMAEYQVVIVKEAQNIKDWDKLERYLEKPLASTILVICYKNGTIDSRKKVIAKASSVGVVFKSEKLKDNAIPPFIEGYVKMKGATIDPKAKAMIADYIGADLSRVASEIDKVLISLPEGNKRVTPEVVEDKIGISKDYNVFELKNALINHDSVKAYRIVKYLDNNPKTASLYSFLPGLFSFFQNLMIAHFVRNKTSEREVAMALGLKSEWGAKDYVNAMKRVNGVKTMQIIHQIRVADAKSKGIKNPNTSPGDILKELVFFILEK